MPPIMPSPTLSLGWLFRGMSDNDSCDNDHNDGEDCDGDDGANNMMKEQPSGDCENFRAPKKIGWTHL